MPCYVKLAEHVLQSYPEDCKRYLGTQFVQEIAQKLQQYRITDTDEFEDLINAQVQKEIEEQNDIANLHDFMQENT